MVKISFQNKLSCHMKIASVTIVILALALANTPLLADSAQGVVYVDENLNGVLDESEKGLAGVRVSNGFDVAVTDSSGRYELPVDGDTVIFVVKPADYRLPIRDDQIPQFYYVHRPQGSPKHFRYPGVESTGPLPESIDFALIHDVEPRTFDAVLFADPQPQTEVELDYIRDDVVAELIGTPARFGMTMGDIMFDDLSFFDRYNRIIARIGVPWFNVPGNHELNFESPNDFHSLETYTRFFGPPYYSFEVGNAVFIVLDNVYYEGAAEVSADNPNGKGSYLGKLDDRQMQWLENELSHVSNDKLVFLAMHIPLMSHSGTIPNIHTQNGGDILALLADHPHVYSVAGHMHAAEHVYLDETGNVSDEDDRFHHHVLSTVSGSWWSGPFDERGIPTAIQSDGSPNGYHVLTVTDVEPTVRFKAASQPADYQMRITFDRAFHSDTPNGLRDFRAGELFAGKMTDVQTESTNLYVNLFDGGPRSKVAYRIDDGEYVSMRRSAERDPTFLSIMNRYGKSLKSWLTPYPSQHLWLSRLPRLNAGTYTIEVEATDEFGQMHRAYRILEVFAQ